MVKRSKPCLFHVVNFTLFLRGNFNFFHFVLFVSFVHLIYFLLFLKMHFLFEIICFWKQNFLLKIYKYRVSIAIFPVNFFLLNLFKFFIWKKKNNNNNNLVFNFGFMDHFILIFNSDSNSDICICLNKIIRLTKWSYGYIFCFFFS